MKKNKLDLKNALVTSVSASVGTTTSSMTAENLIEGKNEIDDVIVVYAPPSEFLDDDITNNELENDIDDVSTVYGPNPSLL